VASVADIINIQSPNLPKFSHNDHHLLVKMDGKFEIGIIGAGLGV
jgi:hypothetical protein